MTDVSTDVSRMFIIIHMYWKRKRYILLTVLKKKSNIEFQRFNSGFTFNKKNLNFT